MRPLLMVARKGRWLKELRQLPNSSRRDLCSGVSLEGSAAGLEMETEQQDAPTPPLSPLAALSANHEQMDALGISRPSAEFVDSLSDQQRVLLHRIEKEYQVLRYVDTEAPEIMRDKDWRELLLRADSKRARLMYMHSRFRMELITSCLIVERRTENERRRSLREKEIAENQERWEQLDEHDRSLATATDVDTMWGSSFLRRTDDAVMRQSRLVRAAYSDLCAEPRPQICVDMRWLRELDRKAQCRTVLQVRLAANEIFRHRRPPVLRLANCDRQADFWSLHDRTPFDEFTQDKEIMLQACDEDYLQMYSREDVIYLSAQSPNALRKFDPSKVYVLPALGLIDPQASGVNHHSTFGQAKQDDVRCVRLPLAENVKWWSSGSKTRLSLPVIVGILCSMFDGSDWLTAIERNIPSRCLDPALKPQRRPAGQGVGKRKSRQFNSIMQLMPHAEDLRG